MKFEVIESPDDLEFWEREVLAAKVEALNATGRAGLFFVLALVGWAVAGVLAARLFT